MAYKEKVIKKLYYSIGEVSELFGVNTSLIRFYEKEFSQLQPKKGKNGSRLYTIEDIEIFKTIFYLVKEKGYTLQGAKDYMKQTPTSDSAQHSKHLDIDKTKLIAGLENIKIFLKSLKTQL